MGKKAGKSSGLVSKGERPNVSRKIRNAMRRDRRENPSNASLNQRAMHRANARGKLAEQYAKEDSIFNTAQGLFSRYSSVATWSACVQAVKTDYVSEFHNRYGSLMRND